MTRAQTVAHKTQRIGQVLLLGMTILSFAACAVGPKYKAAAVPTPPAYKEISNWKTAQPAIRIWGELVGNLSRPSTQRSGTTD